MTEHHMCHVPTVDTKGGLIGLVSQRDILAAENPRHGSANSNGASSEPAVTLAEIMTTPVDTVTENTSLRGAALHLQKNKLGCLPDISNDKLVGIITDSDFVAVAINLIEQLEEVEAEEGDGELT
jgi:CBS domain-containing membrane protein